MNDKEIKEKATEDAKYFFPSVDGYLEFPTEEEREAFKQFRIEHYKWMEQQRLSREEKE